MGHTEHTEASGLPTEGQVCSEGAPPSLEHPQVGARGSWSVLRSPGTARLGSGMFPSRSQVANDPGTW